ncbi:hypothetical protein QTJ16_005108 [Diplocarpon rosae]|uniref:Uncharacterized protein n=1 Tax=Diplocarpon rosae TaxID=946125 RepID=A0AAD9SY95_9HELO|nr:hypothetical protein QTJ16_005108 [Diplocarpon rosae]PBP21968.1 hypothetical protein BUE80_DR007222 [Diplocarpon rosae]
MGPNEKARDIQGSSKRLKNAADNENLPAKGRPARVVLKPDTAKMSSRITLRTPRAKPGSSNSVREPSTRRELLSTPAKASSASLRGTPSSRTRDKAQCKASPASVSRTANKPVLRAITDSKSGSFSQRSSKLQTPMSNRDGKLIVTKPSITKYLDLTPSSGDESDKENAPPLKLSVARTSTNQILGAGLKNPHYQYSNETLLRILENMKISSTRNSDSYPDFPGDELENSGQTGDSPFYADGESSDEGLESKMKDLLSRREPNRRMRRPEVKSVKWDPAILDCGPLTSITNKLKVDTDRTPDFPSQQRVKRSTKDWENNFDDLAEMASELKRGDRRILQKLLEALKHVESSDDSTVIINRQKDRKQSTKDEAAVAPGTAKATKEGTSSSKLNPAAPVYRNSTDIKARMSPRKENLPHGGGQWPLNVRRKRPHSASDETLESQDIAKASKYIPPALRARNILPTSSTKQEPIWINTSRPLQFFTDKSDDGQGPCTQLPGLLNDWLLNSSVDPDITLQSAIEAQDRQMALDDQKIGLQVQPLVSTWLPSMPFEQLQDPTLPQSWWPHLDCQPFVHNLRPLPDWCAMPIAPVSIIPLPFSQLKTFPPQLSKNVKPPVRIPRETESGRTAATLEPAWATQVLDRFTEKYPLTGKVIPPAAPSPLSKPSRLGKNASEIQQKLEELLLYQKEKKVFEQRYITQDMPVASVTTFESSK